MYLTRRSLVFLSKQGALISTRLFKGLLDLPLQTVKNRNSQEIVFAINFGTNAITVGVIGASLGIFTDLVLISVLMVGLIFLDISVAILTLMFFGLIATTLYFKLQKKSTSLSTRNSELAIQGNILILEVLQSFRELKVRNRQSYYDSKFGENKQEQARLVAELTFMPNVSKSVIEISIVFGVLILGGIQFALKDAVNAVGTLAIFFAASSRLAPAILRIQQNFLTFKSSVAIAGTAIKINNEVVVNQESVGWTPTFKETFKPELFLEQVSFKYPEKTTFGIQDVNLSVKSGEMVAIVGPSGAGKTSLVDLILGLLSPSEGKILLSGVEPAVALRAYEGSVAYVPQDIEIMDGTVRTNVCLGYDESKFTDEEIRNVLDKVGLLDFLDKLPNGIDTNVGERGSRFSGGQRQRLGIARALITSPTFIILDEATSALDSESESQIAKSIGELRGNCTILVIAHRLSTVTSADKVLYLENGQVITCGTFSEVRENVPNFDTQASLMGL
jgi:ABC-type multidrug transport system fused ATPase/permease subunit